MGGLTVWQSGWLIGALIGRRRVHRKAQVQPDLMMYAGNHGHNLMFPHPKPVLPIQVVLPTTDASSSQSLSSCP